jgi:hypothetical protein
MNHFSLPVPISIHINVVASGGTDMTNLTASIHNVAVVAS